MSNQNLNKPAESNLSNQLALVNNQPQTPQVVKQSQYKNIGQKIRKILILGVILGFVIAVSGFGYVLASQGSDANSYQFVARFRTAAKSFQDLGEANIGPAISKPEPEVVETEIDDRDIINANKPIYNPPIPDPVDNTEPEIIKSASQASSSQSEAPISEPASKPLTSAPGSQSSPSTSSPVSSSLSSRSSRSSSGG